MTKKDYVAFAKELNYLYRQYACPVNGNPAKLAGLNEMISLCCRVFMRDNPRFDCGRFIEACKA